MNSHHQILSYYPLAEVNFFCNDLDRGWCLYYKTESLSNPYTVYQKFPEAHKRIIWSCSWTPEENYFVTGSRDCSIKIWGKNENSQFLEVATKEFKTPVTAVNFIQKTFYNLYYLIIGFENGSIKIMTFNRNNNEISDYLDIHEHLAHGSTVKRIKSTFGENNSIRIASCSEDHSVRIFNLNI